ncbi:MAG: hypothetical protein DMG70_02390 [Acidobacteria bacterium]|nr:MAG: hypothetical protein DMG70_02390 [Acidobacteriota bacterium]
MEDVTAGIVVAAAAPLGSRCRQEPAPPADENPLVGFIQHMPKRILRRTTTHDSAFLLGRRTIKADRLGISRPY